jgi:hypothetical protein
MHEKHQHLISEILDVIPCFCFGELASVYLSMQRHTIAPDFMMLVRLFNRIYKLGMAYYFTGE